MDAARYIVALAAVAALPPALAFWLIVHPFVGFWRRLGPTRTYLALAALLLPAVYLLGHTADGLLSVDYGTNSLLLTAAGACYVVAAAIEWAARKHLSFGILVGVPELRPSTGGGTLLQEGIYGKVRHPRYVGIVFQVLGLAFFANYLAVYVLVPILVLGLYVVVLFEERELRARFGAAYDAYARRVPRFVPTPARREP